MIKWKTHWYQKFTLYLLIRCYKTRLFLWNTNNTDRNCVSKQNTHTPNTKHLENKLAFMKISDTSPFFKTTPPILATPPYLWEKSDPPVPALFSKISKTQPPFKNGHFLRSRDSTESCLWLWVNFHLKGCLVLVKSVFNLKKVFNFIIS